MSQKLASNDKDRHKNADALDRWADEGGAVATFGSQTLLAQVGSLAKSEREVLQCLGAAVVLQWSELTTDMQRMLFQAASVADGSDAPSDLRLRIARFLHDHKQDGGTQR